MLTTTLFEFLFLNCTQIEKKRFCMRKMYNEKKCCNHSNQHTNSNQPNHTQMYEICKESEEVRE